MIIKIVLLTQTCSSQSTSEIRDLIVFLKLLTHISEFISAPQNQDRQEAEMNSKL